MLKKLYILLFLKASLLLICSCAVKPPIVPDLAETNATSVWSQFMAQKQNRSTGQGFSLKASVHLISKQQRARFLTKIWGNFKHPIRMDLQNSFGSTFAYYREDSGQWLAYYPKEKKGFIHSDSTQGFKSLGVATPFDLQELAWLLGGYWHQMLPGTYKAFEFIPKKGWLFSFSNQNKINKILLGPKGQLLALYGQKPETWQIRLSNWQEIDTQSLPQKYDLNLAEHTRLKIYLKSYKKQKDKWQNQAMELSLPENTEIIYLKRPALFPGI